MVNSIPHPSKPAVLVPPSPVSSMFISEMPVSEVWDVVRRLRNMRSTGMDGIRIFCDLSREFDVSAITFCRVNLRHMAFEVKQGVETSTNAGINQLKKEGIKCDVPQGSILGPILHQSVLRKQQLMLLTIASPKLLNGLSKMNLFSIQQRQALSVSQYLKHLAVTYSQTVDSPTTKTHCKSFLPPNFLGCIWMPVSAGNLI
ncbi:hypothetical protein J6590_040799 [Homalodisca vitripennis]|nr:hypothetical protein J6590_040799 [Homalodisca vitripennis]